MTCGKVGADQSVLYYYVSRVTRHVSLLLSCLALLASFAVLIQIDIPLVRFIRSIHVQWLEQLGDLGTQIGSGLVLAIISLIAFTAGLIFKKDMLRWIGIQSGVAHAAVALLANGLKHLIGRPRPRFTHSGGFQFWPSWSSGLDSFPSGHTSASFAVATVLARYLPRTAWLCYGIATWVAMSRIWRGSHFPTDILAGVILGVTVGMVASRPLHEWRESLGQAVLLLTPYAATATSLLWVACHAATDGWRNAAFMAGGMLCIAAGLGSRLLTRRQAALAVLLPRPLANASIAMGLALTTGSLVVIGLIALTALALWFQGEESAGLDEIAHGSSIATGSQRPATSLIGESLYVFAVVVAAAMIHGLKHIIPMQ